MLAWAKFPCSFVEKILDIFWYSLECIQCVFLAVWESLGLEGEDSWGLWVSIPGIPLKISVLQRYQYSFIPGSQTHNITCSSFFLLSSTSVLEWQLLSFNFTQGKKNDYYTHRWPKHKRSRVQNDPGKVKNILLCALCNWPIPSWYY